MFSPQTFRFRHNCLCTHVCLSSLADRSTNRCLPSMIQRRNWRVQDSKFNFYDRVTHEIVTRRVVKRRWKTSSTSSSRHAWAGNSTRQGLQPDLDEQRFCRYRKSHAPKGHRPPAQGCEERATLGHGSQMGINPNGVVAAQGVQHIMPLSPGCAALSLCRHSISAFTGTFKWTASRNAYSQA